MSTKTVRDSIREKQAAMDFDLRTLGLWEAAEAQGIDSSEGGSFGFDTGLLDRAKKMEYHRHASGKSYHKLFNYFRYPSGVTVKLDPMLEAVYLER